MNNNKLVYFFSNSYNGRFLTLTYNDFRYPNCPLLYRQQQLADVLKFLHFMRSAKALT